MILIKEGENVYVAESSWVFTPCGCQNWGLCPDNTPIFSPGRTKTVVGVSGRGRCSCADVLRYGSVRFPEELTELSIDREVIPECQKQIAGSGILTDGDLSDTDILIAGGNRGFLCNGTDLVMEISDFYAVGSRAEYELSLLSFYRNLPALERIRTVYRSESDYYGNVLFPILYMDTKTCKLNVMEDIRR